MSPRLASAMTSEPGRRASATSRSSSAMPAEPCRSKNATCGLITGDRRRRTPRRRRRRTRASPPASSLRPHASSSCARGIDPGAQRARRAHRRGDAVSEAVSHHASFARDRRASRRRRALAPGAALRDPRCTPARSPPPSCRGRAPARQLAQHLPRRPRVAEGGRADLDGVGPGHAATRPRRGPVRTPPTPTIGVVGEGGPALPDGAHRHRVDARAREAAAAGAEDRAAGLGVEGQAEQRVDQGEPVGARPRARRRRSRRCRARSG